MYATGDFSTIGGEVRERIAALDAMTGHATAWDPAFRGDPGAIVNSLAVCGSTVFVSGRFDAIGGQPRSGLAALDTSSGSATAWNPGVNGVVVTLAVWDSNLYVGGEFTSISGAYRPNLARFSWVSPPRITSFTPTSGRVGSAVTLIGTGFTGASAVAFHGIATTFSVVSGTQITAKVPTTTSGTITVTAPGGSTTSATAFRVRPGITTLSPVSGIRRVAVVITGTNFGTTRGTSYVTFGTTKCGTYFSWSKTRIKCRVPAKAVFGLRRVKVATVAGVSNWKIFRVRR